MIALQRLRSRVTTRSARTFAGSDDEARVSATVHVIHGEDDSTHVLTYDDANDSGVLDCGDRVLTVS